ncbi:hypothetical protein T11_8346 [Trichinella zimbabwensis]|uniref:Uncharacterized protein n=1 Tax=Trichinella zimbabwensis TaxID=268475 RepID=A0A0V1I5W1_9BILA|nr:hypothetical protein T11_8346 [Trichinella zimbabwensis]
MHCLTDWYVQSENKLHGFDVCHVRFPAHQFFKQSPMLAFHIHTLCLVMNTFASFHKHLFRLHLMSSQEIYHTTHYSIRLTTDMELDFVQNAKQQQQQQFIYLSYFCLFVCLLTLTMQIMFGLVKQKYDLPIEFASCSMEWICTMYHRQKGKLDTDNLLAVSDLIWTPVSAWTRLSTM